MSKRRAAIPFGAILGALLLLTTGCGGSSSSDTQERTDVTREASGDPRPGGSISFAVGAETNNWMPSQAQWGAGGQIVANAVFDRLVAYDEEDNPTPYLAEALTPNDDFTQWTITLREGPMFHDGTPVDAEAVKANLEALRTAALTASGTKPISAVNVTGPYEVTIQMSSPWATFPHTLTFQPGYVVAPSMLADPDGPRNPVGSGPFVFGDWVPDSRLTVEKNPDYWREGYPLLDSIEFRVITDKTSRSQALLNGDVDLITMDDPSIILDFEDRARDGELQAFVDPEGETPEIFVALNTAKPPFDNPIAREAVAAGLDKETISETVYEGLFTPADGPFKESSPFYAEVDGTEYDPALARELATRYEEETGEQLSFRLNVTPDPLVVQVAELGQQMMRDVGIDLQINRIEQTQLLIEALGGEFEATGFILFDAPHLDRDYVFFHGDNVAPIGDSALAFTRMDNPRLNDALDAARATDDFEEQREQYAIVQEELAKDRAFVWVVHSEAADFAQNDVRDVVTWEFPDGTPGKGQEGSVVMTYQLWVE